MLSEIYFFFQAEDGIRDIGVTGVQTCALPIYIRLPDIDGWTVLHSLKRQNDTREIPVVVVSMVDEPAYGADLGAAAYLRSEERRVGKECRSRWSPYH